MILIYCISYGLQIVIFRLFDKCSLDNKTIYSVNIFLLCTCLYTVLILRMDEDALLLCYGARMKNISFKEFITLNILIDR